MVRLMNSDEDGDDDVPWSELKLLSNDIPTSPVPESPLLQDDSDDDDLQGNDSMIYIWPWWMRLGKNSEL